MSKPLNISVVNDSYEITTQVPGTPEELDALIGETGATLDIAISYLAPRNYLSRFYGAVSKQLVVEGFPRTQAVNDAGEPIVSKKADGSTTAVQETPLKHIDRYRTSSDDAGKVKLGELLASTASTLPFYAEGDRSGGGQGKLAAATIEAANAMVADGSADANAEIIEQMVPGFKIGRDADGALTPETLARGIQRLEKHLQEEAKNKAKGLFKKG